jgi:tetratricopeptide (TPR) repeat protein
MMRLVARALLAPLVLVFLFAATAVADQAVVVTPTKPPAAQTPPDTAKETPQKPPATQPPAAPQTPTAPPPRAIPADQQALQAAQKITNNDEKIAALEKWLKDFPESGGKSQAYSALFDTLVQHRPTERAAILDVAQKGIDAGPEGFRASGHSSYASKLLAANLFLDDAAAISEKGLAVFEEEETKRTQMSRANHLATLGRIRLKQGRVTDAETALKAAFAANPEIPAAVIGLAELADQRKDSKTALGYWMQAALTGRLSKDDRVKFENAYRASHNGSLDGLEAALDAKYKATSVNPVHPTAYKATPARTNRVVLAEVFTGAGCPPCVAADLAFDAAMERYLRKDLVVVMYHMHIPLPDPLTNKATVERAKYYAVSGVPSFGIDGVMGSGGGARSNTKPVYNRIVGDIDRALEAPAEVSLTLEASLIGGAVKVKAAPAGLKTDGDAVKLQILLVEEMLSYSGENGVRFHPVVVRSIGGANYGGFTVDRAAPAAIDHVFDLAQITDETQKYLDDYEKTRAQTQPTFAFSRKPVAMNPGNLSVVAFLQDEKSKKILQSTYVRLGTPSTTTAGR